MRMADSFSQVHSSFLVLISALLLGACSDEGGSPLVAPELAQASNWTEVFERRTCGALNPGETCTGQGGFHVDGDGRVSIGSENGPADPIGTVTIEEQNAVVAAANAVAAQDLSRFYLLCSRWEPEPGERSVLLKLRLDNGQLWTIYQKSYTTLQVCHRGDEELALALAPHPVCREACKGLCAQCGANLNEAPCHCVSGWTDPRLAGLKSLLTERKHDDA